MTYEELDELVAKKIQEQMEKLTGDTIPQNKRERFTLRKAELIREAKILNKKNSVTPFQLTKINNTLRQEFGDDLAMEGTTMHMETREHEGLKAQREQMARRKAEKGIEPDGNE